MSPNAFTIRHRTHYAFNGMVDLGPHRMMLRPVDTHDQRLVSASLTLSPAGAVSWLHDVFGNSVAVAEFTEPSDTLEILSELEIQRFPQPDELPAMPPAPPYPFAYSEAECMDLGALLLPEREADTPLIRAWLTDLLQLESTAYDALELPAALNAAIGANFDYQARYEEGTQSAADTIALGSGTCRDFAALMIESARVLGYGARFVTGYLYTPSLDGPGANRGAASTHAWAELYIPGFGWRGYDPTNDLIEDADLIRVATVRSPAQAVPVQGSFVGPAGSTLTVEVDIAALDHAA